MSDEIRMCKHEETMHASLKESLSVCKFSPPAKIYMTFSRSAECSDDSSHQNGLAVGKGDNPNCSSHLFSISRRRLFILFLCTFANFTSGCSMSLLAPFFPAEAHRKGMSQVLVGGIFSVYQLMIFVFSPLIGNYLTRIGPKFIHLSSVFVGGTTTVLFGSLSMCPPGASFVAVSFLCRAMQGVGYAGFLIASFAIASSEFPDYVATVYAIIETGTQVGLMAGPVIGGALFDFGGFGLPFYTLGGVLLVNGLLLYVILPSPREVDTLRTTSMGSLLKAPMVVIPMLSIGVGAVGITFLQPTLSNQLQPFGLSPVQTGLFFFIYPLLCCVTGPLWGYLSDKKALHAYIIVIGHFFSAIGFFVIGPVIPLFRVDIGTVASGLILLGATYECTIVPTLKCMVIGALESGFEDNLETYGVVCSLLNLVYFLGGSCGPLVGGSLQFETGTSVIGVLNVAVMVVCLVYFVARRARQ